MHKKQIKLGELLIEHSLITQEQLENAFKEQKASETPKKLGEVLVELGYITEENMHIILAEQLDVSYIPPGVVSFDIRVAEKIQFNVIKRTLAIPFKENNQADDGEDSIEVMFADPLDLDAQDTFQRMLSSKPIKINISTTAEVKRLIARMESYYSLKDTLASVKRELEFGASKGDEESAIMKLIVIIVTTAIRKKASDIHIEPASYECHVRARVDGFLEEIYSFPPDIFPPLNSKIKILGELDIAERRKPQDGRFSLTIDDKEYDFRLSTLPVSEGESIVMRILDKTQVLIKLDELGFNHHNTIKFRNAMKMPYGIIFVTGPTGSGKTTTLYGGLNEIKNVNRKIITVEDPIEYKMDLIQQVQVNQKADLTFANALRAILRQDPDVIMIGESRDLETLSIATQAALTGHLVFTTLHTNDAVSAIIRIVDMGIEPFLVASSIIAIQAQRLARKICPYCKIEAAIPQEVLEGLMPHLKGREKAHFKFSKGKGCKKCNMSGYLGRTIISEVFEFNDEIASAVSRGASKQEILGLAIKNGFEPMYTDGIQKASEGITTLEEVIRVAKL